MTTTKSCEGWLLILSVTSRLSVILRWTMVENIISAYATNSCDFLSKACFRLALFPPLPLLSAAIKTS
jgi:hypothetical protein